MVHLSICILFRIESVFIFVSVFLFGFIEGYTHNPLGKKMIAFWSADKKAVCSLKKLSEPDKMIILKVMLCQIKKYNFLLS